MNTLNKTKIKLWLSLATLVLVVLVGFGFQVYAYYGDGPKVVVEGDYIEAPQIIQDEPSLGAVSSPLQMGDQICANGDCTYFLKMAFYDASTTIAVFTNPFLTATSSYTPNTPLLAGSTAYGYVGATSTVELVRLTITGAATTTWEVDCTASDTKQATSTPTILNSETRIATSTIGVIQSGMTSSTNSGMGSLVYDSNLTTQIVTQITLTPQKPYLVCKVWQPYGTSLDAFTSAVNTFDGFANVRITRQRF